MQKVICIKKCTKYEGVKSFWVSPEVGEVCTIEREQTVGRKKFIFLSEYDGFGYAASNFAILSDTPAEVIKEKETEYETA